MMGGEDAARAEEVDSFSDAEEGAADGSRRSKKYIARPLTILVPRWRERMSLDNVRRCQQNLVLAMRRRVREEKALRTAEGRSLFDVDAVLARDPVWGGSGSAGDQVRLSRPRPRHRATPDWASP